MAEALFRHRIEARPALAELTVASAGTIASDGQHASADAVVVMREDYSLDITAHRARSFDRSCRADLILTVDLATSEQVLALGTSAPGEMLGDFAGTGEEVDDPYGGPTHGFRLIARQLDRLIGLAVDRLEADVSGRPLTP